MDVVCVKERKLNKHVREGFRVLARIIAREYLKNQAKIHDREIVYNDQNIKHIQDK
jgi:hypothetical protein